MTDAVQIISEESNSMNVKPVLFAVVAVVIGVGLAFFFPKQKVNSTTLKLPASFSELAIEGKRYFEANCMVCHGKNGKGTENGPPLIHKIYEPNHHSDRSFYLAVSQGVRSHHWKFGNMPPLNNVTEDEVTAIISYVREIQRANGIF